MGQGESRIEWRRSDDEHRAHNLRLLDANTLLCVAAHLGLQDVTRASSTCRTWRRLLASPVLWRPLAVGLGMHVPLEVVDAKGFVEQRLSTYVPYRAPAFPLTSITKDGPSPCTLCAFSRREWGTSSTTSSP